MQTRRRRSKGGNGPLAGARILLFVTGGIAAYKSASLVRLLRRAGASVRVVMTAGAVRFVQPLTFDVLSEHPVCTDVFESPDGGGVRHIELANWADAAVVAPATADLLAKAAAGIADDLATTTILALRAPLLIAPSMNEAMWVSAPVRRNVERLAADGRRFVEPGTGHLACGEAGAGRMAEPEEIVRALGVLLAPGDLDGVRVLVSAGRTEEEIDPVRYLSNRSSGRMGFALAREAAGRGARVTLVHGPVDVPAPAVNRVTAVRSAAEMKRALGRAFPRCDVLLMAAAVADFTPARRAGNKIKRENGQLAVDLVPVPDILASLAERKKPGQLVVGFALETEDAERNARRKLADKKCDLLVLNRVGEKTGFGVDTNAVAVFGGQRKLFETPVVSKDEAAARIIDAVVGARARKGRS
ncbi:MAG: bifunctional phosphopantothenoylcysteine decarboxylase/phosphopantothenate--cysteine ligase CoaBC [Candidatus Krumholzibacteriota bacterium]|nr:bifunctional phosphopantothenoylcysteine decarboxylase/phosphopantothenate--cysteine ligase CoaBC [Candidatus Krumholzibacteriota bacterium]